MRSPPEGYGCNHESAESTFHKTEGEHALESNIYAGLQRVLIDSDNSLDN